VSPVKYELGFYIPEDDILHSHCRENLKSYTTILLFNRVQNLSRQSEGDFGNETENLGSRTESCLGLPKSLTFLVVGRVPRRCRFERGRPPHTNRLSPHGGSM
jgi:hypothetical protein